MTGPLLQAQIAFLVKATYDRPGLPVPHWEMEIQPGGLTTYRAVDESGAALPVRSFTLSAAGLARVQAALDSSHGLRPCETKAKGLARMGQKTIVYQAPGAPVAECSYNYTENKGIADATDYLQAVATTLEQGAKLERLHRFDRLGLDPVMQQLSEAAAQGRAAEFGSIRPELESLAGDALLLERVRARAAKLLEMAARENAGVAQGR